MYKLSIVFKILIIFFSWNAKASHFSDVMEKTFDRDGLTILAIGSLGAGLQWSQDEKSQAAWKSYDVKIDETTLDVFDFLGTGIPSLGIITIQYFIEKEAAWAHLEGLGYAVTVTHILKNTFRRRRPSGNNRQSFPSGHTTVAFATATHMHYWLGWKVGVPSYILATMVGLQRFHTDRHWVSDVIMGATIGTIFARGAALTWLGGNVTPTAMGEGLGLLWVKNF